MLISTISRFLYVSIALCGLAHVAAARPIHRRDLADALALQEREPFFGLDLDLEARLYSDNAVNNLSKRGHNIQPHPTRQKGTPKTEHRTPKSPKQPKTNSNAAPAKAKKPPQQPKRKGPPNNAKIMLSDSARQELDKMGLHGKDRKKEIKYHKKEVKKAMKEKGAVTAEIKHVAHRGGSDPKEPNHITASLFSKKQPGDTGRHGKIIPNQHNGGPNHHIYVTSKGTSQASKKSHAANDADIKGQSKAYQNEVSKTPTAGKSSTKGKGRQNPDREFSKNPKKLGKVY